MPIPSVVHIYVWFYFIIAIVALLLIDLFVVNRKDHAISIKEALLTSAFWVSVALAFNLWFGVHYGRELGLEFLTGYLVEKSLSIDNLFVILLVFKAFKIKSSQQHRILFWGILGAIVMRGGLIVLGAGLIHRFHWLLYVFGGILVLTAVKFLFEKESTAEMKDHWSVHLLRRFVPISQKTECSSFFVREQGRLMATPLLVALVVVEATDLIFAVDSIPAVFAVTRDSFVAFASNILAILGLRSLFFVLAEGISKFRYLKPGLASVLGFVGTKMMIADYVKINNWTSLLVIAGILVTAGLTSWYSDRVENSKK